MNNTIDFYHNMSLIRSRRDAYLYYNSEERTFVATCSEVDIHGVQAQCKTNDSIEDYSTDEDKLRAVDIIPGNDCNLACSYCYRNCDTKSISLENIQQGMKFIRKICKRDELEFCFIGGEPLLYWDEIESSVSCIQEFFPRAKFVVVTNGTLFTESICDYLSENGFYTIVSIDGNQERHDKARVLKGNQSGTFEAVNEGLDMLKMHNINYALCVTVDEHNSTCFVGDIEWLMDRYKPDDIHVNGILHNASIEKNSVRSFAQGLTSLFDQFNKKGKSLPKQVKRWFLPFISRSEKMHFDCAAFGRKVVMSPNGYHVCEGFASSGDTVSLIGLEELIDTWAAYSTNTNPSCQKCCLRHICKGGCKFNAFENNQQDDGVDRQYCIVNRAIFDHLSGRILEDFEESICEYKVYNAELLCALWPAISDSKDLNKVNWS